MSAPLAIGFPAPTPHDIIEVKIACLSLAMTTPVEARYPSKTFDHQYLTPAPIKRRELQIPIRYV